jgi:osmotically-inducible protein OsmY
MKEIKKEKMDCRVAKRLLAMTSLLTSVIASEARQSIFLKQVLMVVAALLLTSSCIPLIIGGGGVAAIAGSKIATQEKTIGESISDTTIWSKIRTKLANRGIDNITGSINIEVNEGRVLLTGTIHDKNKIITILKVCWSVNGVKEVINELKISDAKESSGFLDKASDTWITSKIKGKFLANTKISTANYTVETIDGIVYLFGTSQSQDELDVAVNLVSDTKGVKRVISYVRVKENEDKKLSKTKGNNPLAHQEEDKSFNDYSFDYSDIHQPEQPTNKPAVIKPQVIDETAPSNKVNKPVNKQTDKVFEADDF